MKKTACLLLSFVMFSCFTLNSFAAENEPKMMYINTSILYTSFGFLVYSTGYDSNFEENNRNIGKAVSLIFFGLGFSSFYRSFRYPFHSDKYENMDSRLLSGFRIQAIIYGLLFLNIGFASNAPESLNNEGRLYFDIGKTGLGLFGLISVINGLTIFKPKPEEPETKNRVNFFPYACNDTVGLTVCYLP